ncbi:MAG: hypothetical protein N3D75_04225 [Candidatus Aenigmarchaeota archaeon]|nr:hypothetical protein [Candidatus Aenigmarchaeota archaeon]
MKLSTQIILISVLIFLLFGTLYLKDLLRQNVELKIDDIEMENIGFSVANECVKEYYNQRQSSIKQYIYCNYTVNSLSDTWIFLEIKKFQNKNDLYNAYEYDSQHLFAADGIISENTYGDKSRFRINSKNDYGAEFVDPNISYYHLWICKNNYLIHITSKGSKQANEYIERMADLILSKF